MSLGLKYGEIEKVRNGEVSAKYDSYKEFVKISDDIQLHAEVIKFLLDMAKSSAHEPKIEFEMSNGRVKTLTKYWRVKV